MGGSSRQAFGVRGWVGVGGRAVAVLVKPGGWGQ